MKCFNNFAQTAVNARRQGDENPNSNVVAEITELFANSSYGYQIMDRSRSPVTTYMNDKKTHAVINSKIFGSLWHISDQLYDVQVAKSLKSNKKYRSFYAFLSCNTLS